MNLTLPSELLQSIANPAGGRVVLVIGAGCSKEAPTNLPLASECAEEAHRQLLADAILNHPSPTPSDLTAIADLVVEVTGSKRDLVIRLPVQQFRQAEPNEGHLLAAALLRERALACVLTLNFDLAMSTALTRVGSRGDVAIISGPEDHSSLGLVSLIYLHRNANADPEDWILTSADLEKARGAWEKVIAVRVISSPVTVFAGLGTPSGVLIETVTMIRTPLLEANHVYQVDTVEREDSAFFGRLDLPDEAYLRMGWIEFMRELAERVVGELRSELETACNDLIATQGLDSETVSDLCRKLTGLGLLNLGKVRARWILDEIDYVERTSDRSIWLADLLLGISMIERVTDCEAFFFEDGIVEFRSNSRIVGSLVIAHGRGIDRWAVIHQKIRRAERHWRYHNPKPSVALVSGVLGEQIDMSPPEDIVAEQDPGSIITAGISFEIFSVDQLRQDPDLVGRMLDL